jgi:hypothetical protein
MKNSMCKLQIEKMLLFENRSKHGILNAVMLVKAGI